MKYMKVDATNMFLSNHENSFHNIIIIILIYLCNNGTIVFYDVLTDKVSTLDNIQK
jgi:hypothetical protein